MGDALFILTGGEERGKALRAAADRLAEHAQELAELNARETGKPVEESLGGVMAGVGTLHQYAELGPVHRGHSLRGSVLAADYTVAEPRGVVVALTPWNDPVAVAAGLLGAAIGIVLGLIGANIVAAMSPLPAAIAPVWIVASIIMGGGVGIACPCRYRVATERTVLHRRGKGNPLGGKRRRCGRHLRFCPRAARNFGHAAQKPAWRSAARPPSCSRPFTRRPSTPPTSSATPCPAAPTR